MKFALPESAQQYRSAFVIDVTPSMASKWLERNFFNRKMNEVMVERYKRDMIAGRWTVTHQGVAFDKNGILLDGQKRLEAVRRSGKTVKMLVFAYQSIANHEAIDCGKVRSNLDVIRLEHRDSRITSKHISTIRAFLAGKNCTRLNISSKVIDEQYLEHYSAIHFAVDQLDAAYTNRIDDPTVRGVVARAYYYINEEKLQNFCRWLGLPNGQPPIIKELADWLTKLPDHRENTRREIYKRMEYSIFAFARDKELVTIPFCSKELFSLN